MSRAVPFLFVTVLALSLAPSAAQRPPAVRAERLETNPLITVTSLPSLEVCASTSPSSSPIPLA